MAIAAVRWRGVIEIPRVDPLFRYPVVAGSIDDGVLLPALPAEGERKKPLLAVAGSTLAGLWLCWWRYAGRGLLTPIMVHVTTNSGALVAAWAVGG